MNITNSTKSIVFVSLLALGGIANAGAGHGKHDQSGMHRHMQEMQKTMEAIHQAPPGEERQALMKKHQKQMHTGMKNMGGMMGMKCPEKSSASKCQVGSMHKTDMKGMQGHMQMMHQMMGHMMEHMSMMETDKTTGKGSHGGEGH